MSLRELVSVIIPFYNRRNYLIQAVESVYFQEDADVQLILVDDGSDDDGSSAAMETWNELTQQSPLSGVRDIKALRINHCGMPGFVRNTGVDAADGRLVAFLDSDDIWMPNKLKRQLPLHTANTTDIVLSHTRERWLRAVSNATSHSTHTEFPAHLSSVQETKPSMREVSQKKQKHKRSGYIFPDALHKCIIGPSTVIMDRNVYADLGGFREDIQIAEDYEFWLRVTAAHEVGYIDEPLVEKRAGLPEQNQLSELHGHIEGFRMNALWELLRTDAFWLTREQRLLAWGILQEKAVIYRAGAMKRGRHDEAAFASGVLQRCASELRGAC